MSDRSEGDSVTGEERTQPAIVSVEVPLLALAKVYEAATGSAQHTYFEGNLGPRHALSCTLCDSIEAVGAVLDANR